MVLRHGRAAGDRRRGSGPAHRSAPPIDGGRRRLGRRREPESDALTSRRSQARAELARPACFAASTLAAIALAVVYWRGGNTQAEGALLAVVTGGIGVGIVVWAKQAMPHDEVTEERHERRRRPRRRSRPFAADFEAGEEGIGAATPARRLAGSAVAALGAALLFPIRSLGPRPGKGLKTTPYAERADPRRDRGRPAGEAERPRASTA